MTEAARHRLDDIVHSVRQFDDQAMSEIVRRQRDRWLAVVWSRTAPPVDLAAQASVLGDDEVDCVEPGGGQDVAILRVDDGRVVEPRWDRDVRAIDEGADVCEATVDERFLRGSPVGEDVAVGFVEDLVADDGTGDELQFGGSQEEVAEPDRVEDVGVEEKQRTRRFRLQRHARNHGWVGLTGSIVEEAERFSVLGEFVEDPPPAFDVDT